MIGAGWSARHLLKYVALFLGELRDGLTMINMQSAFLIVSRNYTEKQAGVMFFVFGISQFLAQTPAGYIMDYSDQKKLWLAMAAICTTILTLATAAFATENGGNLYFMIFIKFLQGSVTAFIPPGLNSITQGIVGSVGMTDQVSKNEMMNHLGTAIIVLTGSLLGFALYPNIGMLFIVSPIACVGVIYFLNQIRDDDIDHDAARGLTAMVDENRASPNYNPPPKGSASSSNTPSFNLKTFDDIDPSSPNIGAEQGAELGKLGASRTPRAFSPLHLIQDPILLTFLVLCFLFHLSNGTILPLVMQTLAIGEGRSGLLFSGLCIIVAQVVMVASAKICGEYSSQYGRKKLFLVGFFTVPVRCLILSGLTSLKNSIENGGAATPLWLQVIILSTQILDGVGAGVFGTMYILVTSDIAGGTGRFSLLLGLTTAAMSIGGTVSGYLGQALAQDLGYHQAFVILGFIALIPAVLYLVFMPETLPNYKEASSPSGESGSTLVQMPQISSANDASKDYHQLT